MTAFTIFLLTNFSPATSIISTFFLHMDSATPSWALWPQSVRLRILHTLLTDGCSLAKLATVSREWQEAIEQHNFARIKVTLPRLASFRSMVRRNRSRVKYIWLCVELDHYSSLESYSGHDRFVSQRDFSLFTKVIRGLFRELSRWEPSGELLLDISIHSPSDSNYLLKYLTFKPDMSSDDCSSLDDVEDMEKAGRTWKEWSAAGKVDTAIKNTSRLIKLEDQSPDEEALDREIEWLDRLPDVPAVTGMLLRQQTRRRWCWDTLTEFLDHFPNLQEVFYEPWRLPGRDSQDEADGGRSSTIIYLALCSWTPKNSQRLLIFDFTQATTVSSNI